MSLKKNLLPLLFILLPGLIFAQDFEIKQANKEAKVFKDWGSQCDEDPKSKKKICYSSQTIMLKENKAEILYIAVGYVPAAKEPLLRLTTPLGTLLPEGIIIKIDAGEDSRLPYLFCNRVGCHVEVGVTDKFLNALRGGAKLNASFVDYAGRKIKVPVSLSGFSKAFASIKSN